MAPRRNRARALALALALILGAALAASAAAAPADPVLKTAVIADVPDDAAPGAQPADASNTSTTSTPVAERPDDAATATAAETVPPTRPVVGCTDVLCRWRRPGLHRKLGGRPLRRPAPSPFAAWLAADNNPFDEVEALFDDLWTGFWEPSSPATAAAADADADADADAEAAGAACPGPARADARLEVARAADGDGWELTAALPGVAKEDIELNTHQRAGTLEVVGRRTGPPAAAGGCRRAWEYRGAVKLPVGTPTEKIAAKYSNGLLTVRVPPAEDAKGAVPIA